MLASALCDSNVSVNSSGQFQYIIRQKTKSSKSFHLWISFCSVKIMAMVGKIPHVAIFKIQRLLQWFDEDEDPASVVWSSIIPHSFILNCFRTKLCLWIKESYLFIFLWLPGVLSVTRATSNRDQIICPSQFSPYVLWEIKSLVAPWLTEDVWLGLKYSSCTVCKVPVGKLVCRLTESFTYIERNSWQRRQPCCQPAAQKTCRESIVSVTPEFASIICCKHGRGQLFEWIVSSVVRF